MTMTESAESAKNTLQVAHQGFENLLHGLATGEWEPLLDLLTEDFTFWFPVGPYHGLNVGKARAKSFFLYVSEVFGQTIRMTNLERVTGSETTVVFEFCDAGMMRGEPYKNRVAVSFDVRADKICGYREYFGSDGKSH
jgi:ketosteroid isomerase-like protein